VSLNTFSKLLKENKVKRLEKYWGWASCDKCPTIQEDMEVLQNKIDCLTKDLGPITQQKTTIKKGSKEKLQDLQMSRKKLHRLKLLLEVKEMQRKFEQELKAKPKKDTAIVYLDFVTFYFSIKKGIPKVINDLVMLVETINDEGAFQRQYYDFISTDKRRIPNDSKFMRALFEQTFRERLLEEYNNVFIFSDGGGKHFKTSFSQRCAAELQLALDQDVKITWIVFAAKHGWNICDSHGGVLSQMKNRIEIAEKQPKTANNWIQAIQEANLKETKPIGIGIVDQRQFGQKTITGIKDYFCFRYVTTQEKVSIEMFEHYYCKDSHIEHFDLKNGRKLNV
jgi:hypothetical protein